MRIYECRYVRREDPGDLVWGYYWRPAILVDDGTINMHPSTPEQITAVENNIFDMETGKNVGDTRNFCINPHCCHEDCAPLTLIWEGEGR
jgi:hypothetical protein